MLKCYLKICGAGRHGWVPTNSDNMYGGGDGGATAATAATAVCVCVCVCVRARVGAKLNCIGKITAGRITALIHLCDCSLVYLFTNISIT